MLLETTTALYGLLTSINDDKRIQKTCMDDVKIKNKQLAISVLMSEKYREVIALQEKEQNTKLRYPIIVLHDNEIEYDRERYYNDMVEHEPYEAEYKGEIVIRTDEHEPYMPYNLNYRIEIVCKQRIHLDNILVWVMENIPERGCLDIPYIDEDNNDAIYNSLLKRGPIIKADEGTSSVLYRRTSEIRLTTLLGGKLSKTYTKVEHIKLEEKGDDNNGKNVQGQKHQ